VPFTLSAATGLAPDGLPTGKTDLNLPADHSAEGASSTTFW
jgi:hypothetical protein